MSRSDLLIREESNSPLIPPTTCGEIMPQAETNNYIDPRERLIVALDLPDAELAGEIVEQLGEAVSFYKIGLQLLSSPEGFKLSKVLEEKQKNVFLDYKFSDIGNTIKNAVESVKRESNVSLLTVMGDEEIVANASQAALGTDLKILAVTVLTTWTDEYIKQISSRYSLEGLVLQKARIAKNAGAHGVIASAWEVEKLKKEFGKEFLVVTPGIRPKGAALDDQKRVATPYDAISKGADYIVVGRPITKSDNPQDSANKIIEEIVAGRDTYERS